MAQISLCADEKTGETSVGPKEMFAARHSAHPPKYFETIFVALLILCGGFVHETSAVGVLRPSQNNASVTFELPANGNLRVENARGGVMAEVWSENYVSVSAISDTGAQIKSTAVIQASEGLLSVRVLRGANNAPRVNLELKIPARAHAAILTGDGSVTVQGLPAAILVQTLSGEIRLDVPASASASVVAESKTGTVSSSLSSLSVRQAQRPQLQASLGAGKSSVRLFSGAGNISLNAAQDTSERVVTESATRGSDPISRRETLSPGEASPASRRPELSGPDPAKTGAGTPAPKSSGPEEVSEDDVIRVDTELVSVNVSVVDRNTSRVLNNLTRDDFHLYEDNAEQEIRNFESSSAPFNLVLLVDLSGSTAKVVELIKSAAQHFVDAARPFDRIGIITFAGGQVVVSPLTSDRAALRQRISSIEKPEGSTRLYDSLAFAMNEVFREAKDSRRNAIVVISDGLDSTLPNVTGEGSTLSYEEVIRRVKEFDGLIYSIWVKTQSYVPLSVNDIQQETFDLGHDDMKDIAETGGGSFYECKKIEDLADSYDRVVADLGTLYTLSYRPTNKVRDGAWRTIRVNVNRPGSVARGKRGYFAK